MMSERAAALVAGIQHEAGVRRDPALGAERLVAVWGRLEAEHARLDRYDPADRVERRAVEGKMRAVASELKGNPALARVLRERQSEFGIEPWSRLGQALEGRSPGEALVRSLGQSQSRGLSR